jgi:hypothetical protein
MHNADNFFVKKDIVKLSYMYMINISKITGRSIQNLVFFILMQITNYITVYSCYTATFWSKLYLGDKQWVAIYLRRNLHINT